MAQIIRTERSQALWGVENVFGLMSTPVRRFGIHDTLVAPDPDISWTPFFGVGSQNRNRDTILRGKHSLIGSIPDIRLQGNADLSFLLAHIWGTRTIINSTAWIVESGNSILGANYDGRIPSMTMQVAYHDTGNGTPLIRNFVGGKINRATLAASEGEELRLSLEEMMFLSERHNRVGVFGYDPSVFLATDPGLSDAGRFTFVNANIGYGGMTLARCRKWSISVDNQLEYRYYIKTTSAAGAAFEPSYNTDRLQLPNDIVEGKRTFKLEMEVDLGDPTTDIAFFEFLRMEGGASTLTKNLGLSMSCNFSLQPSEGNFVMTIIGSLGQSSVHPGSVITSAKHSIPAPPAGLIPVTLSVDVDSIVINTPF